MAGPVKSMSWSTTTLEMKLRDLNATMQSIQSVSQWLIHHRKHARTVVGIWFREMQKASPSRKLTLLYVANDVIQNARRKGPEYKAEFTRALPRALHLVAKDKDETVIGSVQRIISVWEERHVFDIENISKFKNTLSPSGFNVRRTKSESDAKLSVIPQEIPPITPPSSSPPPPEKPPNNRDPPEADALLKHMNSVDREKSTVQDMAIRQKIASFPSQLYDADILSKLKTKESGEEVMKQLEESLTVLSGYTERMEKELSERRDIQEMLDSFIWHHQCLLHGAKERQREYQGKMQQCTHVREVLKSHIASLPNLAAPSSEGLAPLPSAGDLFS